jgi:hypothetical protein
MRAFVVAVALLLGLALVVEGAALNWQMWLVAEQVRLGAAQTRLATEQAEAGLDSGARPFGGPPPHPHSARHRGHRHQGLPRR